MTEKISKLSKSELQKVREKAAAALAPLGEELGVQFRVAKCKYDPSGSNATFDLEVAVIQGGAVMSKEVTAFNQLYRSYGLKAEDLGRSFLYGKETYTLAGLAPSRSKFPIVARKQDGSTVYLVLGATKQALLRSEGKSPPHFHGTKKNEWEEEATVLEGKAYATQAEALKEAAEATAAATKADPALPGHAATNAVYGVFAGCTCANGPQSASGN